VSFRVPLRLPFGVRIGERALRRRGALSWIDDFFREARHHIHAREEDGVVILPPNQVYKANATGIAIVRHMLGGGKVADIPGIEQEERAQQVVGFVSDLRALYLGEPAADGKSPFETVPYDFQYTTLPILGEIAVTYRCNNACLFCYAGCGTHETGCGTHETGCGTDARCGADPNERGASRVRMPNAVTGATEMSLTEIKRVIGLFKTEAKIPFFSFTGGEPTLRSDLEDMIVFARRQRLQVNLITNATLIDKKRARSLFKAGLRTAQVSIESSDAETHDTLTARPGSFAATLEGIHCLQKAGVSVQTNTTVNALNASAVARMPLFLKSLGVSRFAMNLFLPPSGSEPVGAMPEIDATVAAEHAEQLFVPYTRAGAIIEAVRATARAEGLTFYWYSPIPHCHYNTIAHGLGNKSCAAMDGLLSVSPSGDVLPCSSYPEPMGNLLTQEFTEIWFSARARHFKRKEYAPAECAGCESFTACQAACPLYWRYAGTSEIRNPNATARQARAT
jgi:radical SAM protein with 4Fe4S-binding SPASM domain